MPELSEEAISCALAGLQGVILQVEVTNRGLIESSCVEALGVFEGPLELPLSVDLIEFSV